MKTAVNLWEINKNTKKGDSVMVPGKVLGEGKLDHSVNISAKSFSDSARKKMKEAGAKIITEEEARKNKAKLMK